MDKPIMKDPMDSEEAGILYISKCVNATPVEIKNLKYNLMDNIECNFSERECNLLYTLAGCDLLNSSESKMAIMLMAQKLGNIPIPKEDNE